MRVARGRCVIFVDGREGLCERVDSVLVLDGIADVVVKWGKEILDSLRGSPLRSVSGFLLRALRFAPCHGKGMFLRE